MDEIARQMALLKFYLAWSRVKSQSLFERTRPPVPAEREPAQADELGDERLRIGHC
jgi:hypothetical protein